MTLTPATHGKHDQGLCLLEGMGIVVGVPPDSSSPGKNSCRSPVRAPGVMEKSFSSGGLGRRDVALRAALCHEGHKAQGIPLRDLQ